MKVLVNTVRVRVLTEDGQTLPVQLSAQWGSATQMSAEVFQVRWRSSDFFLLEHFRGKRHTKMLIQNSIKTEENPETC